MSVIYNTQYVDEKYLPILEPNLYYNSVLQPGITFTQKYTAQAGGIFIHKLGGGTGVAPTTPGSDFSDAVVADSLIQAVFNNNFKRSRKIYGVTASAVAYDKRAEELAEAIKEITQGWQSSGVAAMVYEASDYGDTTAITYSNIKSYFIGMRKWLVERKANPTFAIFSPDVFEAFLTFIGTDYTPSMNDSIAGGRRMVDFLGIKVIEANLLVQTDVTFYDYTGALRHVDLSGVDIIMGDGDAFSAINNFETLRTVDSERFAGALAQVEMNSAFRVTNATRIVVKQNSGGITV